MSDPAPKESFDHTKPLTTTRSFMGGNRYYKMNERFDPQAEGCSPERTEDLYDAGYLRYGDPRPRVPKAERDKRNAEAAKAQALVFDTAKSKFAEIARRNRERKSADSDEPAEPLIPEQQAPNVRIAPRVLDNSGPVEFTED